MARLVLPQEKKVGFHVTDHIKRIKVEKMIFLNKYRNTFDNIQLNDYKNKP